MYPEACRVLMFRGAEVILHPTSDQGAGDTVAWESAKKTRASENMVYLVSSNSGGMVGSPPSSNNMGHSKVIDYDGRVLADSGGPGESLRASAVIDVQQLRWVRQQVGPLNRIARQRTEMYLRAYQEAHFYPPNRFVDEPMASKAKIAGIMRETMQRLAEDGVITPPSM
jgi:predicted amidohydrolase